jgi:hypothetical protein
MKRIDVAAFAGWGLVLAVLASAAITPEILPYPKAHPVYQLGAGETIKVDGILNESAWAETGWSTNFVDIAFGPTPRFATKFKARWTGTTLYVGYFLEDPQIWANITEHDEVIFYDNDAELFIDPDGSCASYKELEVNALATTWDLILDRPYIDGGSAKYGPGKWDMPDLKAATQVYGCTINDPTTGPCSHWTLELALPLDSYVVNDTVARSPPVPGDLWRWDFSRVEWHVTQTDQGYQKVLNTAADNWVWSSQGSINMHLPERWGYLCWLDSRVNVSQCRKDDTWGIRQALAAVYYASHQFSAVNGYDTSNVTQLGLPQAVLDGSLGTQPPTITVDALSPYGFNASVSAKVAGVNVTGYINTNRHFVFDPPGASVFGVGRS